MIFMFLLAFVSWALIIDSSSAKLRWMIQKVYFEATTVTLKAELKSIFDVAK